ncbi:hypothetical protein ACFRLW_37520 [Streptomyces sp. NPDC056728]
MTARSCRRPAPLIVLIVDFPDPVSMAAVSLTVKASGAGLATVDWSWTS